MTKLRAPEKCPCKGCCGVSRVLKKRERKAGVIWRRHECLRCRQRWSSYQSLVDPKQIDDRDIPPCALDIE